MAAVNANFHGCMLHRLDHGGDQFSERLRRRCSGVKLPILQQRGAQPTNCSFQRQMTRGDISRTRHVRSLQTYETRSVGLVPSELGLCRWQGNYAQFDSQLIAQTALATWCIMYETSTQLLSSCAYHATRSPLTSGQTLLSAWLFEYIYFTLIRSSHQLLLPSPLVLSTASRITGP